MLMSDIPGSSWESLSTGLPPCTQVKFEEGLSLPLQVNWSISLLVSSTNISWLALVIVTMGILSAGEMNRAKQCVEQWHLQQHKISNEAGEISPNMLCASTGWCAYTDSNSCIPKHLPPHHYPLWNTYWKRTWTVTQYITCAGERMADEREHARRLPDICCIFL